MAHLANNKEIVSGLELAPLRSLNDFILDSARFQIPNLKDLDKWGNRVFNNLLYYQTNYFFMAVIIFFCVGIIHPGKMIVGMISTSLILSFFIYISTEGTPVHNFKKQNPLTGLFLMIFTSCFLSYTLGSLLVFLVGILLPFSVIFIHASLRLRNFKNKLINKIEGVGLKRSPMGYFLEQLENIAAEHYRHKAFTNIKFGDLSQWNKIYDEGISYQPCCHMSTNSKKDN